MAPPKFWRNFHEEFASNERLFCNDQRLARNKLAQGRVYEARFHLHTVIHTVMFNVQYISSLRTWHLQWTALRKFNIVVQRST